MAKKIKIETLELRPVQIMNNEGQVKGLPKNPRFIRDKDFLDLVKSIEEDPEFTSIREVLVIPFKENYVIVAGNMRFRAMVELGWKKIPCKILPKTTPGKKLRAYATKDNVHSGKDDWDIITNEWDTNELESWGKVMPFKPEEDKKDKTNIKITVMDVNEDERENIKNILIKSGYKVK
jgi:hypothetical protein